MLLNLIFFWENQFLKSYCFKLKPTFSIFSFKEVIRLPSVLGLFTYLSLHAIFFLTELLFSLIFLENTLFYDYFKYMESLVVNALKAENVLTKTYTYRGLNSICVYVFMEIFVGACVCLFFCYCNKGTWSWVICGKKRFIWLTALEV